tara:strand:+ start:399 stop:833 length:435 start_codon:yes stop_codon:yes gene_type:complete
MEFNYNDGGRSESGYKGETGDCFVRALAIVAELPYKEAYDLANEFAKDEKASKRRKVKSNARTGYHTVTAHKVFKHLGWKWTPTMFIGSGCTVHLNPDELPSGRIVCNVTKHFAAVIDGVLNDTADCSREETRCVYGYWWKEEE